MRALVACEYSGRVRDAFIAKGFDAVQISEYPHYAVTRCGRVFSRNHASGSLRYFKEMTPSLSGPKGKQYLRVLLCGLGGKRRNVRVHTLVAEAFCERKHGDQCVRHLNGDKLDNRAENLAWGTYAENEEDKRLHGTWDSRRNGKLCPRKITLARNMWRQGKRQSDIAKTLGVSRSTITRLINGTTWGNIPCAS